MIADIRQQDREFIATHTGDGIRLTRTELQPAALSSRSRSNQATAHMLH